MNASFEEKSVWIQLVGTVAGLGAYVAVAARMKAAGVTALPAYVPLFVAAVAAMTFLLVSGHVVAAIFGRAEAPDERDRLIEWKSGSQSSWILVVGVFAALTAMVMDFENPYVAHLLLATVFLAEIACQVLRLARYRRGL